MLALNSIFRLPSLLPSSSASLWQAGFLSCRIRVFKVRRAVAANRVRAPAMSPATRALRLADLKPLGRCEEWCAPAAACRARRCCPAGPGDGRGGASHALGLAMSHVLGETQGIGEEARRMRWIRHVARAQRDRGLGEGGAQRAFAGTEGASASCALESAHRMRSAGDKSGGMLRGRDARSRSRGGSSGSRREIARRGLSAE